MFGRLFGSVATGGLDRRHRVAAQPLAPHRRGRRRGRILVRHAGGIELARMVGRQRLGRRLRRRPGRRIWRWRLGRRRRRRVQRRRRRRRRRRRLGELVMQIRAPDPACCGDALAHAHACSPSTTSMPSSRPSPAPSGRTPGRFVSPSKRRCRRCTSSTAWRRAPARSMCSPRLRVWDTEHNNGVLIYVQLADRGVEIVADRGFERPRQPRRMGGGVPPDGGAFSRRPLRGRLDRRGRRRRQLCWRATFRPAPSPAGAIAQPIA